MRQFILAIVLVFLSFSIVTSQAANQPLQVVATTTIIADVAQKVGGDFVNVSSLVPPNADAHAFEPTPQDALKVSQADVVLAAGAGYEAFLSGLMENASSVPVVTVSNGVTIYPLLADEDEPVQGEIDVNVEPLGVLGTDVICDDQAAEATEEAEHAHGGCDPHVWTDPQNGMIWADNIGAAFAQADPDNAAIYTANAEAYKQQLTDLDAEIRDILAQVPEARRILVTNHEFMSYFARAYGFRLAGVLVPGGTSTGETDPQALAELLQTIQHLQIPAIFAEETANTKLIDTLAQDIGVKVVSALSESLTTADGEAPTYIDYLRYNAQTIADALK